MPWSMKQLFTRVKIKKYEMQNKKNLLQVFLFQEYGNFWSSKPLISEQWSRNKKKLVLDPITKILKPPLPLYNHYYYFKLVDHRVMHWSARFKVTNHTTISMIGSTVGITYVARCKWVVVPHYIQLSSY